MENIKECIGEACEKAKTKVSNVFRSSGSKSYNPFKMSGSYIGLISLPIISFISVIIYTNLNCNKVLCDNGGMFVLALFLALLAIPVGFLIGWGIHALVRKLRNG